MVRSMAKRGMPKPFAVLLATVMALYFVPFAGVTAANAATQYTLEGCRLDPGDTLPNDDGDFICDDEDYTTGNLGKLWNELDLVPHRVTVDGEGTTEFVIAADYSDGGKPGYDVLSEPVLNEALSDAGCAVTSTESDILEPGQGGADETIYRIVTVTFPTDGGTCVFDYYQRLALGSHLYPGSSLHSNLLNTEFDTGGIGAKEVSIPVKEIEPQDLDKTMTATQGTTYNWTLTKNANPTSVNFPDTCPGTGGPTEASVTITLNWTRSAATPSGDITLTTQITATNPAHRTITVNVTDRMYEGSGQSTLLATNSASADVSAERAHTFTFVKTVTSSSTTFNDVATATYTDKVTGIAVPGTVEATASATVTPSGVTSGATATLTDIESISGAGFSFSVDSVTPGGDSPNAGTFTDGYTLGTETASNVSWSSGTIAPAGTAAASGNYTFEKTVYVADETVGSGTLSDTATLTPQGQNAIAKTASVALTADAADPLLAVEKKVDIAPEGADAVFTFEVRAKDSGGNPTGPTYTFTVTIKVGETSGTSASQAVAPSEFGYAYKETADDRYTGVDGSFGPLDICDDVTEVVNNSRDLGKLKIQKVLDGDIAGADSEFTVHVDCPGTAYDQDIILNASNNWTDLTGNIPTGTVCSFTETGIPDGWELVSIQPSSTSVGEGTPVSVSVVVTNKRLLGKVTITKVLTGPVAGASTEFTVNLDCDGTAYDHVGIKLNEGNGWSVSFEDIPSGVTCQVTEPTVPAGWTLGSIDPVGSFVVDEETDVTVTVTNIRDVGSVVVNKVILGDVAGATTDFTVLLDCDGTANDATLVLSSANNWTARVDNIPTLVQCQVTEPTVPAGWNLTSINPSGKFTIQKTTVATVTVTNTRATGVISVTKVLDGAANGASTTFTFDVDCLGTTYDQAVTVNVTSGTSATGTTGQIPTGLSCTVTERATPDWKLTAVVPQGGVVAVGSTVTFTNQRLQGTLNIAKEVSPVAGNGVVVEFGDTLTYTLTVSATGEQRQPNVVVTDYLPGLDPERPASGSTTYVPGSAACVGGGVCEVTEPGADGLITWRLGEMAAGTTRQVTFQVVIDSVEGEPGTSVAVDILNAGAVQSDRVARTPSNEVVTPVTAVFPIKIENPPPEEPAVLPRTGSVVPVGPLVGTGLALLGLGLLLLAGSRRRGVHRRS